MVSVPNVNPVAQLTMRGVMELKVYSEEHFNPYTVYTYYLAETPDGALYDECPSQRGLGLIALGGLLNRSAASLEEMAGTERGLSGLIGRKYPTEFAATYAFKDQAKEAISAGRTAEAVHAFAVEDAIVDMFYLSAALHEYVAVVVPEGDSPAAFVATREVCRQLEKRLPNNAVFYMRHTSLQFDLENGTPESDPRVHGTVLIYGDAYHQMQSVTFASTIVRG